MVPREHPVLDDDEQQVEHVPEDPDEHDARPHVRDRERPLRLKNEDADPVASRHHLAHDDHDERERKTRAHSGKDLRSCRGKCDLQLVAEPVDAVHPGGLAQSGVHSSDCSFGIEEHGPEADEGDQNHLRGVVEAQHDDDEGNQRDRRDRAQELEHGCEHRLEAVRLTENEPHDHADDHSADEPDHHPGKTRQDVARHPREEPVLLESD